MSKQTGLSMGIALVLAAMADRVVRTALAYRTVLIWPYAVAPAVAGVLWWFLFNPTIGIAAYALDATGYEWNHYSHGADAMALIVIAAAWRQVSYNFLFFLEQLGASTNVHGVLEGNGNELVASLPLSTQAGLDDTLVLSPVAGAVHLFDAGTGRRLEDAPADAGAASRAVS